MTENFSQQQWSVNVTDDDTRNLTPFEIGQLYAAGQLDLNDTYVWRDGMEDWLPLGQCPDLRAAIEGSSAQAQPAAEATPAQPAYTAPAQPAYSAPPEPAYTAPAQPAYTAPEPAYTAPAQPAYAAPEPSPDPYSAISASASALDDRRVGQRNEESALFSLDDIRAAASSKASHKSRPAPSDDPFDDLINFSAVGGGGIAAAFAPPPINAPAPPEPKPQPVAPPAAATAPMAAQASAAVVPLQQMNFEPAPKKGGKGVIIGVAAVVVLAAAAGAMFFLSAAPSPSAKNDTAQASDSSKSDGNKDSSGDAKPDDGQAADDRDKPSDGGDANAASNDGDKAGDAKDGDTKAAANGTSTATAATAPTTAKGATTTKSGTDTKPSDDKPATAAKPDEPKPADDKKDDPAPAKAEFNVNAARSALAGAAGAASGCKKADGPTGKGRVTVTFAPSGRATQALIGPPFAGTSVGSCAAAAFKRASVPPFTGSPMSVSKSFYIQ